MWPGRLASGRMLRPLAGPAELLAATGSDPFLRSQLRGARRLGPAWSFEGAVGWVGIDAEERVGYLSVLGTPAAAARLVAEVADEARSALSLLRISVPRGTPAELSPVYRLESSVDWDFRWTRVAPPPTAGERLVQWLVSPADERAVAALLEVASPRTSVRPRDPDVRRWAGIRGQGGRLDACAADTSGVADVGHVSALATRSECRGRGLGTAVTGWLTRQLLAEFDLVTLGVYADNAAGLRLYDRLGYAADHHFTSGVLRRC